MEETLQLRPKQARKLINRVMKEHARAELERDRIGECTDLAQVRQILLEAGVPRRDIKTSLEKAKHRILSRRRARRWWKVYAFVIAGGVAALGYQGFAWAGPQYDEMVAQREAVRREWAQVDTQLQRRYDLIPNLVETVSAHADHETELLTDIAEAHAGYVRAESREEKIQASYAAERSLRSVTVLGARYPQLQASQGFNRLMSELATAEDRIADRRMKYNDAVAVLNTEVQSVGGSMVAAITGIEVAEYYNPPVAADQVPVVNFD